MNRVASIRSSGNIFSGSATIGIGVSAAIVVGAVILCELASANWQIVLYALISLLLPAGVALHRIKQFGIADPGAVFLAFFSGYNGLLLLRIAVGDLNGDLHMPYPVQYSSDVYTEAALLSFTFSIALAGTLLFLSARQPTRQILQDDINTVAAAAFPVGCVFFTIGVLFHFANLLQIGSFRETLALTKMARFELIKNAGMALPFMPFTVVGLMFLALAYWKMRSQASFIVLVAAGVFWSALNLFLQDRSATAYSLLAVVGLLSFLRSWRLSYKLVGFALLLYFSFTLFAQVRWIIPRVFYGSMSSTQAGEWVQENQAADWVLPENSEFSGPYFSVVYAVDNPGALKWGKSYVDAFTFFLPRKLYPGEKPQPLAEEFAKEIHNRFASAYFPVAGWGYSPVAEAYVNFSWFGVVVLPIIIGVCLDMLERFRWRNALSLICVMSLLPQMQNANRINFLWAFNESLFFVAVSITAVESARFVSRSLEKRTVSLRVRGLARR
jgi:hypothetical protein